MLVCVLVYLANVCESNVVVRCCFASQLRVLALCVCVQATVLWSAASQCTVVCWRCVVYRWRWTCDDVCVCGCVDGGVYMDGVVVCGAVRAAWTLTVFCCCMALLADGWDVI